MVKPKNLNSIVNIMLSQHDKLQEDLAFMRNELKKDSPSFSNVFKTQKRFEKKLLTHLKLENKIFYPCLLNGLRKKNISENRINDTISFIKEMDKIATEVTNFLKKYNTISTTKKKVYASDLDSIIASILLRIESEENGVYLEWDVYGDKQCDL